MTLKQLKDLIEKLEQEGATDETRIFVDDCNRCIFEFEASTSSEVYRARTFNDFEDYHLNPDEIVIVLDVNI